MPPFFWNFYDDKENNFDNGGTPFCIVRLLNRQNGSGKRRDRDEKIAVFEHSSHAAAV